MKFGLHLGEFGRCHWNELFLNTCASDVILTRVGHSETHAAIYLSTHSSEQYDFYLGTVILVKYLIKEIKFGEFPLIRKQVQSFASESIDLCNYQILRTL